MKKLLFTGVLYCMFFTVSAQERRDTTGKNITPPKLIGHIISSSGEPLENVMILNMVTNDSVNTNSKGAFVIIAAKDQFLRISKKGYGIKSISLENINLSGEVVFVLEPSGDDSKRLGAISPESYWVGAKIGYNFDGFGDDFENSFIGAAKVFINTADKSTNSKGETRHPKLNWGIIGNISDFITNTNREDANKNLQKIALSVEGFGAGLYWGWKLNKNETPLFGSKFYLTSGYRLNTYKNVGADSNTVNLSQWRSSIGFECEGFEFSKKGKLNLSAEASVSAFSPKKFESVFEKEKSLLLSFEVNAILPFNDTFGFYSSGTFAPDMKPVFMFGIIIKQSK